MDIGTIQNTQQTVLSIEDVAVLLGISKATVRNWVKSGYLPAQGEAPRLFFHKKDIDNVKRKLLNGDIEKLIGRANKLQSNKTFIPKEYLKDEANQKKLHSIIRFIRENNVTVSTALFIISLNFLQKQGLLKLNGIQELLQKKKLKYSNKQIEKEMQTWFSEIKDQKLKKKFSFLLECELPAQRDNLGLIYQSLLFEGAKSRRGSYYTPTHVVSDMIKSYAKPDSKVLDPCCGTGQFLLTFADKVKNPKNIYGIDYDKTAVQIARINLLVQFKSKEFAPNVFCKNTLLDTSHYDLLNYGNTENIKNFNVIATNPPWGVSFSKGERVFLKRLYPEVTSFESFSYFLQNSLDLLCNRGTVSFILPESILNVKIHKDIRKIILTKSYIMKIVYLGRVFKNVFTPVIRLDLKKTNKRISQTLVQNGNKKYKINQNRWLNNTDYIFNIHSDPYDFKIIDKVYNTKHINLQNKAEWALGIVTGNNKRFLSEKKKLGFEPVYKGKDIHKFVLSSPSCYIQFQLDKFQQTAPINKYRVKEKLIYRFVSKKLVFAYDNKKRLTLNSANVVIPQIENYPIKVILALFNSSLYQFLFQKKFSSIKVLRSHIEELPLPLWRVEVFSKITAMVNTAMKSQKNFNEIDHYIMDKFGCSQKEKIYINSFCRQQ